MFRIMSRSCTHAVGIMSRSCTHAVGIVSRSCTHDCTNGDVLFDDIVFFDDNAYLVIVSVSAEARMFAGPSCATSNLPVYIDCSVSMLYCL